MSAFISLEGERVDGYSVPMLENLRAIYPTLNEEELAEAAYRLERYLAIVAKIYEEVRQDPERYARLQEELTKRREERKLEERSKIISNNPQEA